jgi:hypothetical protein
MWGVGVRVFQFEGVGIWGLSGCVRVWVSERNTADLMGTVNEGDGHWSHMRYE